VPPKDEDLAPYRVIERRFLPCNRRYSRISLGLPLQRFLWNAGGLRSALEGENMPADANSSPNVPDLQQRVDELAAELRARSADYQ
jgi:hypothetical protein